MGVSAYTHSGKLGSGPIVIPLLGIPAALALSIIYGYVCAYMPCVGYLSAMVTAAYGYAIGRVVSALAKSSKCRNPTAVIALGILVGIAAWYGGWAGFLHANLGRSPGGPSLFQVYTSPAEIWDTVLEINETGYYTVRNLTPTGILLWIFWSCEAAIIIGFAAYYPYSKLKEWVFCEPCNRWCKEKDDLARFSDPAPGKQLKRVKDGDLTVLGELKLLQRHLKIPHVRVNTRRCESCGLTESIQVHQFRYTPGDKGDLKESSTPLTPHFLLDNEALSALQSALIPPVPPAAPKAPA